MSGEPITTESEIEANAASIAAPPDAPPERDARRCAGGTRAATVWRSSYCAGPPPPPHKATLAAQVARRWWVTAPCTARCCLGGASAHQTRTRPWAALLAASTVLVSSVRPRARPAAPFIHTVVPVTPTIRAITAVIQIFLRATTEGSAQSIIPTERAFRGQATTLSIGTTFTGNKQEATGRSRQPTAPRKAYVWRAPSALEIVFLAPLAKAFGTLDQSSARRAWQELTTQRVAERV